MVGMQEGPDPVSEQVPLVTHPSFLDCLPLRPNPCLLGSPTALRPPLFTTHLWVLEGCPACVVAVPPNDPLHSCPALGHGQMDCDHPTLAVGVLAACLERICSTRPQGRLPPICLSWDTEPTWDPY